MAASYSRFDDTHHSHLVTAIRKHVEGEIRSLTDQPFDLFRDSESIKPGELWPEKLKKAVDASVVLVPVVTPSLGRNDLILPIYLTSCPVYSAPPITDAVALTMQSHQWVDITAFRHDSAVECNLKVALDKLTSRIAELIATGAGSRT